MASEYGSIHEEVAGVNPEGFVAAATLAKIASGLDRSLGASLAADAFARAYPVAALVLTPTGSKGPSPLTRVLPDKVREQSFQRTKLEPVGPGAERYRDQIGFLAKRPGNPFPHMISLGRAQNNDLVLALDTISKFHGYFVVGVNGVWTFTDGKTTAGTSHNGNKLEAGAKCDLADGDWLQLGTEIALQLCYPLALYAQLKLLPAARGGA